MNKEEAVVGQVTAQSSLPASTNSNNDSNSSNTGAPVVSNSSSPPRNSANVSIATDLQADPQQQQQAHHPQHPRHHGSTDQQLRLLEDECLSLRESENKLKQQLTDSQRRERILMRRLTAKEQELHDYVSQVSELKAAQAPGQTALKNALLDPAVNILLQKFKDELQSTRTRLEETQNELSAWKFTPDSNTGKRLMAKCRLLYQENEELGKMTSNGRLAKLESDLAMQKTITEDMKKTNCDLEEVLLDLEEDVESMQSTILLMQQELQMSKDKLGALERENMQLKQKVVVTSSSTTSSVTNVVLNGAGGGSESSYESSEMVVKLNRIEKSSCESGGVVMMMENDARRTSIKVEPMDSGGSGDDTVIPVMDNCTKYLNNSSGTPNGNHRTMMMDNDDQQVNFNNSTSNRSNSNNSGVLNNSSCNNSNSSNNKSSSGNNNNVLNNGKSRKRTHSGSGGDDQEVDNDGQTVLESPEEINSSVEDPKQAEDDLKSEPVITNSAPPKKRNRKAANIAMANLTSVTSALNSGVVGNPTTGPNVRTTRRTNALLQQESAAAAAESVEVSASDCGGVKDSSPAIGLRRRTSAGSGGVCVNSVEEGGNNNLNNGNDLQKVKLATVAAATGGGGLENGTTTAANN